MSFKLQNFEEEYFNSRNDIPEELFDGLKQVGVDFNGKRVLDLGAGPGFLSAMLSDKGAVVDALEPSEAFRNMGKSYTNGKNVTFYDGLAEDTGLVEDEGYDIIFALRAWQYFDSNEAVKEVKRLLKPHGLMIISDLGFRVNNSMMKETMRIIRSNSKYNQLEPAGSKKYSIQMINSFPVEWFSDFNYHKFDLTNLFKKDYQVKFTDEEWLKRIETSSWLSRFSDHRKESVLKEIDDMLQSTEKKDSYDIPHVLSTAVFKNRNKK